jgi:hypothetical protein
MITYDIKEGQLVRLFHGRPDMAWDLPTQGNKMKQLNQEEVNETVVRELHIALERLRFVGNNIDSISMRHECTAQLEVVQKKLNYLIDLTK